MSEHRHEWMQAEDGFACTECTETCPACMECGRPVGSSLLICERCLSGWRRTLERTVDALMWCEHVPEVGPRNVKAATYGGVRVSGTGTGRSTKIKTSDIVHVMTGWARLWHSYVRDPEPVSAPQYLVDHLIWAAHNTRQSDWEIFKAEMRACYTAARVSASLLPERMPWPCVYCGGVTVQDRATKQGEYLAGGLSDEVRCTGCGTTWPNVGRFERASREWITELPQRNPDATITLDEAVKAVWPSVPASTIYSAVKRDRERHEEYLRAWDRYVAQWNEWAAECDGTPEDTWPEPPKEPKPYKRTIPDRGHTIEGVPTYRVGDLEAIIERRSSDTRRGPKVRDTPDAVA